MAGSSMEFWFEFDNFFNSDLGEADDDALAAISAMSGAFGAYSSWRHHRQPGGHYPEGFQADMEDMKAALMTLADQQLAIFDRHFHGDRDAEQNAFEEFGQGLNFDDRRPSPDKVHKMDTGPPGSRPAAYHAWHGFMRAIVLLGGDEQRWLGLNRNLGLAWAIQNEALPVDDEPHNPPLPQERLEHLRTAWLALDVDGLNAAFDNPRIPPQL